MTRTEEQPRDHVTDAPADAPAATTLIDVLRRPFSDGAGVVALLAIVAHLVWRAGSLRGGWFTQHDYLHHAELQGEALTAELLTSAHAGEYSPLGRALTWGVQSLWEGQWGAVVAVLLVLQGMAALLLWVALSQIAPGRFIRFPFFAAALTTPLVLSSTFTWSVAAMFLPGLVLTLVAVVCLLGGHRQGLQHGAIYAGVAVAAAMLAGDRFMHLPFLLFFLVAAVHDPASDGLLARLRATALQYARLWIALGVLLLVRWFQAPGTSSVAGGGLDLADGDEDSSVLALLLSLARLVATGLAGGPWEQMWEEGRAAPVAQLPLLAGVAFCLFAALLVMRSVRSGQVATALVALVVCVALLVVTTLSTVHLLGPEVAVARAAADVVIVVVLLGAAGAAGARWPRLAAIRGRRVEIGVAALVTVAVAGAAVVTTQRSVPSLQNLDDREFARTLASEVEKDPRLVLLDAPAPDNLMGPAYGDAARLSTVAAMLPERPLFDLPSEFLRLVATDGTLDPVEVDDPVALVEETDECGVAVTRERQSLELEAAAPEGDVVLEFAYLTGDRGELVLTEEDGSEIQIPVRSGLAITQVPIQGGGDELTLATRDRDQVVCLDAVKVGRAVAAGAEAR